MWEDWHDIIVYKNWSVSPFIAESSSKQRLSEVMLTGRVLAVVLITIMIIIMIMMMTT